MALEAEDLLSLGGDGGEEILHMRNRQCCSEKVILGEMTSQSRMKQYPKQTLCLEYQRTQFISKYWLDAKPEKEAGRKKSQRKDPSKVIKHMKLLPLADNVLR